MTKFLNFFREKWSVYREDVTNFYQNAFGITCLTQYSLILMSYFNIDGYALAILSGLFLPIIIRAYSRFIAYGLTGVGSIRDFITCVSVIFLSAFVNAESSTINEYAIKVIGNNEITSQLLVFIGLVLVSLLIKVQELLVQPFNKQSNLQGKSYIKRSYISTTNVAYHEVGHTVLLKNSLEYIPEDFLLEVKDSSGSITFISEDVLNSRQSMEFFMLMLLGGIISEEMFATAPVRGSSSDLIRWEAIARNYLLHSSESYFFASPQCLKEIQYNKQQLENLKNNQRKTIEEVFEANSKVIHELAEAAIQKQSLSLTTVMPYLEKVTLPHSYPKIVE